MCNAPDRHTDPFGTCVHLEHIVMRVGSAAVSVAANALILLDEVCRFGGVYPNRGRTADHVIQSFRHYEGPDQHIRRAWSDNAAELTSGLLRLRARALHPHPEPAAEQRHHRGIHPHRS